MADTSTEVAREVRAQSERLAALEQTQMMTAGECRIGQGDIVPLHPVLAADGLRWCCSHEDQHCTVVVAEIAR